MVVRAGGPPSTNVLILAFVLPLSLFVGTLVAAARVADDLDERFLREVRSSRASILIKSLCLLIAVARHTCVSNHFQMGFAKFWHMASTEYIN